MIRLRVDWELQQSELFLIQARESIDWWFMKKILLSATALSTVLLSGSVIAADLSSTKGSEDVASLVPKSGLSLGLGGNLNLATFS
mgnify:FL=1